MTIARKIIAPYLALLLTLCLSLTYLSSRFNAARQELRRVVFQEEQVTNVLNQLEMVDHDVRTEVLHYRFDADEKRIQEMERKDTVVLSIVEKLQELMQTEQGKDFLLAFSESRAQRVKLRERLIDAVHGADEPAVRSAYDAWIAQDAVTETRLRNFITFKRQLLHTSIEDLEYIGFMTRWIIASAILLTILIAIAASVFYHFSIVQPLQELSDRAKRIAEGDLSVDMSLGGMRGDEIGHLATAFRLMIARLRNTRDELERKVTERTAELHEAKERIEKEAANTRKFHLAVESSFHPVFMALENGDIVYVNPAWEKLTGHTRQDVLGKNALDIVRFPASNILAELRSGKTLHSEEAVGLRRDGSPFDMELTIYPLEEPDGARFFVGVAQDITRRKRIERAKTDFVSLASHQLRTPLTAVRWALGRMRRESAGLPESHAQMLAHAAKATLRMAETIDTMLAISRVEAEHVQLSPHPLPLSRFLQQSIEELHAQWEEKKQTVRMDCPSDLTLLTDANVLKEIVGNLLSNAVKYTPEHGTITVRAAKIGRQVRIDIADSGFGIPRYQQEKVFTKFFRGDNIVQNEPDGTGLGLYLVYALTRLIGGTISFVSHENAGSTFTLLLPLTRADRAS